MRINSGRRRRCVAIHGVVACRYSTASRGRCIDMRLGHGIIAHRIQAETARGPSLIAIERHRFMRINTSRPNRPSHRCRRAQTTRTIKATCLVRVRRSRPSLANDSPFGLDVDPLDRRRVYAHKLPDSLASAPPIHRKGSASGHRSAHPLISPTSIAATHPSSSPSTSPRLRHTIRSSHRSPPSRLCA